MPESDPPAPTRDDYTIAWISALAIESAAAAEMLDEEHPPLAVLPGDSNNYVLGRIGHHRVVMACMNGSGGLTAQVVATHLMKSFSNVEHILIVGIGAGIPSLEYPIRLGDVVVSEAKDRSVAVVQCDFGKHETEGFMIDGSLNRPADSLIRATGAMKRNRLRNRSQAHKLVRHFSGEVLDPENWKYQGRENDPLHRLDGDTRGIRPCAECATQSDEYIPDPEVHYGVIASGSQAIKSRKIRDEIREELGACCIETEAFGLINQFPCLVIRGIDCYADEDQTDRWQQYAALTAAAYAKELSLQLPMTEGPPNVGEQLEEVTQRLDDIQIELKDLRDQQRETINLIRSIITETELWQELPMAIAKRPTRQFC